MAIFNSYVSLPEGSSHCSIADPKTPPFDLMGMDFQHEVLTDLPRKFVQRTQRTRRVQEIHNADFLVGSNVGFTVCNGLFVRSSFLWLPAPRI
jgi:hypothetical protein